MESGRVGSETQNRSCRVPGCHPPTQPMKHPDLRMRRSAPAWQLPGEDAVWTSWSDSSRWMNSQWPFPSNGPGPVDWDHGGPTPRSNGTPAGGAAFGYPTPVKRCKWGLGRVQGSVHRGPPLSICNRNRDCCRLPPSMNECPAGRSLKLDCVGKFCARLHGTSPGLSFLFSVGTA